MGILQLLAKENYIAYSKPLAKIVGIDEAILFGELCSMSNLFGYEFFCEYKKLCDDTCMTEYRVRNALKNLVKIGLITIEKKGLPAKNYYTLSEEKFLELVGCQSTSSVKFDSTGDNKIDSTSDSEIASTGDIKSDSTFNKNKNNKNKIQKNKNNKNKKDISTLSEFERLWKLYPNKKGKENAKKAFNKAIKDGVSIEDIENGIIRYAEYIKQRKTEMQFIKHGGTWFNQRCWQDDYETEVNGYGADKQNNSADRIPKYGEYI